MFEFINWSFESELNAVLFLQIDTKFCSKVITRKLFKMIKDVAFEVINVAKKIKKTLFILYLINKILCLKDIKSNLEV